MKRRRFIGGLLGALSLATFAFTGRITKYGTLSVRKDGCRWRVWLDGVDVSNSCYEANDMEGWVKLLSRDRNGKFYLNSDRSDVARETRYGLVKMERIGSWNS